MRLLRVTSKYVFRVGLLALMILFLGSCSRESYEDQFLVTPLAAGDPEQRVDWREVTDKHRCYLKIQRPWRSAFRVNCFQINGELHTHSNRFVEYNQWLSRAFGFGDAWVYVIAMRPELLVAIDGQVHKMRAELVSDEGTRKTALMNRGYDPVPEAIRLYRLMLVP